MARPESLIQQQIVELLSTLAAVHDFVFFSVPNESFLLGGLNGSGKQFGTLATLKKMGMRPGAADLVIGHEGKIYCMEVKDADGQQSADQLLFEAWCVRCGVPYVVVRSSGEVLYWLREWGIIPQRKERTSE